MLKLIIRKESSWTVTPSMLDVLHKSFVDVGKVRCGAASRAGTCRVQSACEEGGRKEGATYSMPLKWC